jgi:Uma2 family endonuclease
MEAPLEQLEPPDISALVTEDDAPVDNLPSEKEQRILTEPLYSSWSGPPPDEDGEPRSFVAAANVGLFASLKQPPIVPDVFLSLDVKIHDDWWDKQHRSYLFWEFGKPPEIVIEIVSNREGDELGKKRRRYASMRIANYVVYDPTRTLGGVVLQAFELRGSFYVPVEPWFESIGLGLVVWDGVFEGVRERWLRWCTRDGIVVPTGAERAEAEHSRAEAERSRADQAEARAHRLSARLQALGIDPNSDE